MKTIHHEHGSRVPRLQIKRCAGMALVIVLASLVFLAALALAFLASVSTELRSSKVYSQGANAKLLAQTAVNLAMAQISEGTKGVDGSGNTLAWASQPGMIRTYDASGQPASAYKLYSWTEMTTSGAFDHTAATNAVPATWAASPAIFTDLNQPMTIGTNRPVYPVIDGNDLKALSGNQTYDADNNGIPDIEGFSVASSAPTNNANPVPMPVKWLYVLENGKIVAPTPGGNGSTVTVSGTSATNQITGRIAFWADDETCKVNVNTASEGSYIDMPRFNSTYDRNILGKNQPAKNEYQRYPGHPATTSLSTVFRELTNSSVSPENIYPLTPRYMAGGSKSGTTNVVSELKPSATAPGYGNNRLYASVDELVFQPALSGGVRINNDTSAIDKSKLEKARFFATASSKSPDVNLHNKPRIGIWPVSVVNSSDTRTIFDQLIAFCGTMRNDLSDPYRFFFQRSSRDNPKTDLPDSGSITGLGRNRMLLNYLGSLANKAVPGFGGKFSSKYSTSSGSATEMDQIITEIFDFIRTSNLIDPTFKDKSTFKPFAPVNPPGTGNFQFSRMGQVIPIEDGTNGTRGYGRFITVSRAFLHFIGTANNSTNGTISAGDVRVQSGFFLEVFSPSLGFVNYFPDFKVKVSGLDAFRWGKAEASLQPMGLPAAMTLGRPIGYTYNNEQFVGGAMGYTLLSQGKGWSGSGAYPFISGTIDLSANGTFSFQGGDVKIEILDPDTSVVLQTLTMNFPSTTASTQFPVPDLADVAVGRKFVSNSGARLNNSVATTDPAINKTDRTVTPEDTIRSVEVVSGDIRMTAAKKDVPSSYFAPHSNYTDPTKRMAHSLRTSMGNVYYGATGGRLVKTSPSTYKNFALNYTANNMSTIAWDMAVPTTEGVALGKSTPYSVGDLPGDWDNGMGAIRDGPYINKSDEGHVASTSYSDVPYFDDLRYLGVATAQFSPNRQTPSPVIFGSLPTGVIANRPWQTLLFRPGPTGHPGLVSPRDHLLLDWFSMPVVEPYAISEPLATDGRINMNFQICPFNYINRDTGVRAILKSEKVISIPDSNINTYKGSSGSVSSAVLRRNINASETLKGFSERFNSGDIFRSASEICDVHIVPDDGAYASMGTYWDTRRLTGDNSRERPYATIYPRLTTKSNTFTVHYRAQSLKKVPGGAADVWDERRDKVTGEDRGYQTIERYIDPNDPNIPDYADPNVTTPISDFYKFRVIQAKEFAP